MPVVTEAKTLIEAIENAKNELKTEKIIYTKKDGVVNLAQPRESQRLSALQNNSKNQEKNDIRELERQERGNNPLVWASIVLAKDVLNGRQITQAKYYLTLKRILKIESIYGGKGLN